MVFPLTSQPLHPAFVYGGLQLIYLLFAEEEDDALEVPQVHIAIETRAAAPGSGQIPVFWRTSQTTSLLRGQMTNGKIMNSS